MAADDAAVVVTLRANLKDYEAALKSAVRATEKAAKAAEAAVSGIGKGAKANFAPLNDNFQKSAGQIASDARILQFQLNDIFSGLASGQGIRALQVQLGQIAQQMSGGSLALGARTLGAAFLGMLNPINLAVVAFGFAATAAASYFSSSEEDSKKATEELKKHAKAIQDLADKYGALFPELERVAKKQQEAAEAAEKAEAAQTALAGAYDDTKKALKGMDVDMDDITNMLEIMGVSVDGIVKLQKEFGKLTKAVDEHRASSADAKTVVEAMDVIIANSVGRVQELAKAMRDELVKSFQELDRAAASAGQTIQRALQYQMPGAGGPIDLSPLIRAREDALGRSLGEAAGAIDSFVERVIRAESSGSSTAKNPLSSATGAGQFISSTWLSVFKDHFASEAAGMSDAAILALRTDIETNRRMIRAYAEDNTRALLAGGMKQVDEAMLHLAHFLGPGGALKVLQAKPGTKIADIPGMGGAIASNKSILGGGATREDVLAYAQRRAGTEAIREQKVAFDELFAANERRLAQAQRENEINRDYTLSSDQKKMAVNAEAAAAEEATIKEQLLNAAKSQGLAITPELTAKINEQAHAMAQAGLQAENMAVTTAAAATAAAKAAKQTAEATAAAQQVAQQVAGIAQGAIIGLVQDFRNGTDAAEAFYNAISRIADQLLSMALNMAIQQFMKSMFAGPMGGLPMGPGLYASGGYTGDIPAQAPAGIVHGREFVVNAAATQKHRALLESINRGLPGYASGGFVLPSMPSMRGSQAPASQSAAASVDARTTVVNTFDAGSFLSEALSKPDGVKVILNAVRAQPGAFRQAMQS
jgi:hypothetical protein